MRRFSVFMGVLALLLTSVLAVPAGADRPVPLPTETVTFPAENPCTGEIHLVTLIFENRLHEHKNSASLITRRSGETSDGFVMQNGRQLQQINFVSTLGRSSFMDMWVNRETGARFKVSGTIVAELPDGPFGDPVNIRVDNFTIRCVK